MAYETTGQHLAWFLRDGYLGDTPAAWTQVETALLATGRSLEWVAAIQEMTCLSLTRRLIAAGVEIVARLGGVFDALAERDVKQLVFDTMVIDYFEVGDVVTRLEPALRSARRMIAPTTRRELEAFARREMPYCYLCGADLDFEGGSHTAFTLDHVWPRAYGGDSDPENLLPACSSCNTRKDLTPSWSMYPIQALIAGYQLGDAELTNLPKEMRFAVHSRAAAELSGANGVSLKEAFLDLGRPDIPSVIDVSVAVDVFNLAFARR